MVLEENMKLKIKAFLVPIFASTLLFTGCSLSILQSKSVETTSSAKGNNNTNTQEHLQEDKRIYSHDQADSIKDLYVTIQDNNQNGTESFFNLEHWYDFNNHQTPSPTLDVIIQEGNSKGPQPGYFGNGQNIGNASMEIRGSSTRAAPQKSLKLKLYKNAGLWNGQTTLDLNKHPFDFLRVRNKLSFDYFKLMPNMTSLRTQFIHLHVKDLTSPKGKSSFEDMGLFTQVEQPNHRFLASHDLDPNGQLYKAKDFEFYRYPETIKLATDPKYNETEFNKVLKIKGTSKDHIKLINMLKDVNNDHLNINDVIDKYFDRDNYLTWLAANILMGNLDTNSQNFLLYSPTNSNKFYFMPWDYDGAWGVPKEIGLQKKNFIAKWQQGASNYWNSVLHRRFFKDPQNIKDLSKKIEEVSKIITPKQTKSFLDSYYPIVSKFVKSAPDLNYETLPISGYDQAYKDIINEPERNKELYFKNLENPMPIYLGDPELKGTHYQFDWDQSYDLQGDELKYDFQISQTIDFSQVYYEKKDLSEFSLNVDLNSLKKGRNFWRVIVTDSKGNSQIAYDSIEESQVVYNGEKQFYIK
jgi:spore coat protein H